MAIMITTIDNPFDPFTDYKSWLQFDMSKFYNTNELLARFADFAGETFTDDEEDSIMTMAASRILKTPGLEIYIIVEEGKFKFDPNLYDRVMNDLQSSDV